MEDVPKLNRLLNSMRGNNEGIKVSRTRESMLDVGNLITSPGSLPSRRVRKMDRISEVCSALKNI